MQLMFSAILHEDFKKALQQTKIEIEMKCTCTGIIIQERVCVCVCMCSGLTTLSTVFQSYYDDVWLWPGAQCSLFSAASLIRNPEDMFSCDEAGEY